MAAEQGQGSLRPNHRSAPVPRSNFRATPIATLPRYPERFPDYSRCPAPFRVPATRALGTTSAERRLSHSDDRMLPQGNTPTKYANVT